MCAHEQLISGIVLNPLAGVNYRISSNSCRLLTRTRVLSERTRTSHALIEEL